MYTPHHVITVFAVYAIIYKYDENLKKKMERYNFNFPRILAEVLAK